MGHLQKLGSKLSVCMVLLTAAIIAGCGGIATVGGPSSSPTLSLSVVPTSPIISSSDSFFLTVYARETVTSATPSISLGTLPAGLTTTSTFPMNVPSGGATINFTTSSSIATGDIAISISGTAGGATAKLSVPLKVIAGTPVQAGLGASCGELQLAQGDSTSIRGEFASVSLNDPVYEVALSITGLPSGITATIDPTVAEGDTNFTVNLTASSTAPVVHNAEWNIVATPTASVAATTTSCLLDITPASGGVGWSNQTGYVSLRATPSSAVYDRAHQLIYAANTVWNRIDIISDKTRAVVKSISIREPLGMDISVDGSIVWVATGSQVMYAINTTTFQVTRYILPRFGVTSSSAGIGWGGRNVLALADGTLLVSIQGYGAVRGIPAIWNPATNELTELQPPNGPLPVSALCIRSGDGKRVFVLGANGDGTAYIYDVPTKTFSPFMSGLSFGGPVLAVANFDGSRVAVSGFDAPPAMLDGNLNLLGILPGDGGIEGTGVFPAQNRLTGGIAFSQDGATFYEETQSTLIPVIASIDVATLRTKALAPAMPIIPTFTEMKPRFYLPDPFAVDSAGMVLGIQYHGISFDDATAGLNYSPLDTGSPLYMQHMSVYSGPLAGGTTSNGFGNSFSFAPDVYYGGTKGTVNLSSGSLSITSPPSTSQGPVDVKMLFPDGSEVFDPQFFTYGTKIQDALISGGSPQGGAAAKLDAFGLPLDPSKDTVTIGGNTATVTSTTTQYPPFTGEQTDMFLSYKAPSGAPGWADLTVTTPNGTSTLPHAFFFAKSVTDYSTSDSPTFVLYDKGRNQLYLSAGDHIDVFSLSSDSFSTPLQPPAIGTNKQFEGLALTPDGKYLLATDLTDDSLAVINPDDPSTSFAISVATGGFGPTFSCPTGPLFVAADNMGNAYVVTGGVIGYACGPGGYEATVNLVAKTSALFYGRGCDTWGEASYVRASGDGSLVAFGGSTNDGTFQMYVPAQAACMPAPSTSFPFGVTVAADGNVIGLLRAFVNSSGNIIGRFAYPEVFYPFSTTVYGDYSPYQDGALQNPTLNDTGSLYYWAYPNYIDIVDVQHGTPALRFGLTETVANTVSPMAIDSSGRRIFLITDKGLTVVDLGNAPLSIGHFSETSAAPGSQIEIRGSGFENGITATLGGAPAMVTFTDSETITIAVPTTNTGPEDLVLTNPDGTTYTLQNAITVQ